MLASNVEVIKQQLICDGLNYNKNKHLFFTKFTIDHNKKNMLPNNVKLVKQQLICYRLNYNKNKHLFLQKVTVDHNKKIHVCQKNKKLFMH
jgi:hypothetical protein